MRNALRYMVNWRSTVSRRASSRNKNAVLSASSGGGGAFEAIYNKTYIVMSAEKRKEKRQLKIKIYQASSSGKSEGVGKRPKEALASCDADKGGGLSRTIQMKCQKASK